MSKQKTSSLFLAFVKPSATYSNTSFQPPPDRPSFCRELGWRSNHHQAHMLGMGASLALTIGWLQCKKRYQMHFIYYERVSFAPLHYPQIRLQTTQKSVSINHQNHPPSSNSSSKTNTSVNTIASLHATCPRQQSPATLDHYNETTSDQSVSHCGSQYPNSV